MGLRHGLDPLAWAEAPDRGMEARVWPEATKKHIHSYCLPTDKHRLAGNWLPIYTEIGR